MRGCRVHPVSWLQLRLIDVLESGCSSKLWTWKRLDCVGAHWTALCCLIYILIKPTILCEHSFHPYHVFFAVDQVKFGPPLRKVTEPNPDLVMHFFCKIFLWQCCILMTYVDIHKYDQTLYYGFPFSRALMMTTGVCQEEKKITHRKTSLCFLLYSSTVIVYWEYYGFPLLRCHNCTGCIPWSNQ